MSNKPGIILTSSAAKTIHRKKLFGGVETAQEIHRRYAWGEQSKCYVCASKHIVIQFSYHMNPKELLFREPKIAAALISQMDSGQLPVWQSKYGPMVNYWVEYACEADRRYVEREAAKLPSYILVEIDRGVGEDKLVVAVPGNVTL